MFSFLAKIFRRESADSISLLAEGIAEISTLGASHIVEAIIVNSEGELENSKDLVSATGNEILYFLMHCVNRLSLSFSGQEVRKKFSDELFAQSANFMISKLANLDDDKATYSKEFDRMIVEMNKAELDYSACNRFSANSGEEQSGTLLWEAAKRVTITAGGKLDGVDQLWAAQAISSALSTLELEVRVKNLLRLPPQ